MYKGEWKIPISAMHDQKLNRGQNYGYPVFQSTFDLFNRIVFFLMLLILFIIICNLLFVYTENKSKKLCFKYSI